MQLIIRGLRKAVSDSWGDLINLIAFNGLCFLSLLPGLAFFSVTIADISLWTVGITAVLLLPSSIFLFALYEVAYGLNQDNVVKFVQFFQYMRQTWRQALIWGGINLLIVLIVIGNIMFYSEFVASWAGIMQFIVLSCFVVWCILQLFVLPMYPRLQEPGFKIALRNAMAISGSYSLAVLVIAILTAAILLLTLFFQFLAVFLTFFTIVMFGSSMLAVIFKAEFNSSEGSSQ